MSSDESFLARLFQCIAEARLDAVMVGMMAAVVRGAPVTTRDVDLLIRRTRGNVRKVEVLCAKLGGLARVPASELSNVETLVGAEVPIDLLYDELAGGLKFASVKARSTAVTLGDFSMRVASLEDIIRAKEAAARPKDLAQLPILRETKQVLDALER